MKHTALSLFIIVGILFGCNRREPAKDKGNALSGSFTIYSDETFRPLVETLVSTYMSQYASVKITTVYGYDAGNLETIAKGDYETYITSHAFSNEDSAMLSSAKIFYHIYPFAMDAVIAIRNKNNPSKRLNTEPAAGELCKGNDAAGLICTDNSSGDNAHTIWNNFSYVRNCYTKWFACGSDTAVISYVEKNVNATGFISYTTLSDKDQPEMMELRNRVAFVALNKPVPGDTTFVLPSQQAISTHTYPLVRKINIITTEAYAGPATGFAAYVASHEGQQIIRLLGLVPATMPTREIIIN